MAESLVDKYKILEKRILDLRTEKVRLEERLNMLAAQKEAKLREAGVNTSEELTLKVLAAETELKGFMTQWERLLS